MRTGFVLVISAVLVWGCGGKSAADYEREAQAAMDGRDVPKAIAVVNEALQQDAVKADAAGAWRLEQLRLDALAKSAKGDEVKAQLDRLAAAYPKQVTAALYRSLADKTKAAGDTPGAITILTAGDQRFPADHTSFADAIATLKQAGALDPTQVDKLKALGYL
jgi:hypothetical protein